jgi:hypothetical protein
MTYNISTFSDIYLISFIVYLGLKYTITKLRQVHLNVFCNKSPQHTYCLFYNDNFDFDPSGRAV